MAYNCKEINSLMIDVPKVSAARKVFDPGTFTIGYPVANPVASQMIPIQDDNQTFSTTAGAMWGERRLWNTDEPIPFNVKDMSTASEEAAVNKVSGLAPGTAVVQDNLLGVSLPTKLKPIHIAIGLGLVYLLLKK